MSRLPAQRFLFIVIAAGRTLTVQVSKEQAGFISLFLVLPQQARKKMATLTLKQYLSAHAKLGSSDDSADSDTDSQSDLEEEVHHECDHCKCIVV